MIADPESYANEYELDARANISSKRGSDSVSVTAMRLWLRAAHAVVELTGPTDSDGKTFGSDGNVSLWLHESDLALGNILLDRISNENAKLREMCEKLYGYYVSGTLSPCDFCDRYDCEGNVQTTCKADEYDPDGMVVEEIERRMRELGMEVE